MLIEFWDFCRPNSIRTLPYLKAWHARYAELGLRVIGVHSAGFEPSDDPEAVAAAVERLGIEYPVVVDVDHQIWQEYENLGWPARYLWNADGFLFDYHFGEGGYAETELAIQELLGIERETLAPVRPEDESGRCCSCRRARTFPGPTAVPTRRAASGPSSRASGVATVNGTEVAVPHPGAYELIVHEQHTEGVLELDVSDELCVLAVCFTPGLAGPGVS